MDMARLKQLIQIWEEEFQEPLQEKVLMPTVPVDIKKGCILFIGLNPSFNNNFVRGHLPKGEKNPESYFSFSNREHFDPKVDVDLTVSTKKNYPYFIKFRKASEVLGKDWEHLDLFFWRGTSQGDFTNRFCRNENQISGFCKKQMEMSFQMIEEAKPICIVVANAFASKIFIKVRKQYVLFANQKGCFEYDIKGKKTPIFFSSMLTGGRALDNHSYLRLIWHMAKVLRIEKDFNKVWKELDVHVS